MIEQDSDLLVLTKIDRQNRPVQAHDRPQRLDPAIPPTITTSQPTTLGHERPPRCVLGSQARLPHQEDVPDLQQPYEVFLRLRPVTVRVAARIVEEYT